MTSTAPQPRKRTRAYRIPEAKTKTLCLDDKSQINSYLKSADTVKADEETSEEIPKWLLDIRDEQKQERFSVDDQSTTTEDSLEECATKTIRVDSTLIHPGSSGLGYIEFMKEWRRQCRLACARCGDEADIRQLGLMKKPTKVAVLTRL